MFATISDMLRSKNSATGSSLFPSPGQNGLRQAIGCPIQCVVGNLVLSGLYGDSVGILADYLLETIWNRLFEFFLSEFIKGFAGVKAPA